MSEQIIFDINAPRNYLGWREKTLIKVGQMEYAVGMGSALRMGHVDDEATRCKIPTTWTWVAPGTVYRGILRPSGLTGAEFLEIYPAPNVAALTTSREKFRVEYIGRASRCVNWLTSLLSDNTIRFLNNLPEFERASNQGDLVLFMHVLNERGQIGTGTREQAALSLEQSLIGKDAYFKLKHASTGKCDLGEHTAIWTRTNQTLKVLMSSMSERMKVSLYLGSLPEEAGLTGSPLNNTTGMPINISTAINYFSDMVTSQGIPLNDCGSVFGVARTKASRKREEVEGEDGETNPIKMCATLKTTVDVLALELAEARKHIQRLDGGRDKANKGDEGRERGSRNGAGKNRAESAKEFFNRECKDYQKNKTCDYESRVGSACKFNHSGSNAKKDGIIKTVKFTATEKK